MKSIYLDASVPSCYYEKDTSERGKITRKWWDSQINSYRVVISTLILKELKALETEDKRKALLSLVEDFPVLKINPLAERLARNYIEEKIIPYNVPNDALHIALVVVYKVDILLTWDLAHLARKEVERKVNAFNIMSGYPRICITTPEKLLKEGGR